MCIRDSLHSPIVALVGAVTEARKAVGHADDVLTKVKSQALDIDYKLINAERDLADAQEALKACEGGLSEQRRPPISSRDAFRQAVVGLHRVCAVTMR